MEGRSAERSTFVLVSARRFHRIYHRSCNFGSFCGGHHLLSNKYCTTGAIGAVQGCFGSNTIACVCRRGLEAEVFQLVYCWRLFPAMVKALGDESVLPFFYRGLMYMCCVRVRTYIHKHCMWPLGYSDVSPGAWMGHLESPEEIVQMDR